jgi:chromosome segregation and condensation protein ScpB
LIDRSVSKTDERMVVYNITSDTIRFLGIKSVKDLPEYEDMNKQLEVSEELENTEE